MPASRLILPDELSTLPFTHAAGMARGLRTSSFRSNAVRRLAPRVFQAWDDGDPELKDLLAAHLATMPAEAVVDGVSALQMHGIDLGTRQPLRFCVPEGVDVRRIGTRVRRLRTVPPSVGQVQTPPAAFAAAAADLDLVDLVAAGDWLVRAGKTEVAALQAYAADQSGRHCRTVRAAAALVRERVHSPAETRLRLCLVLAGLPEPVCNLDIGDDLFFVACPDLTYLRERLALEYEGDQHRTDRRQWDWDITRERRLRQLGYEVLRITGEAMRRPRDLVEEVYQLLVQRGYDGSPPTFSPTWRARFAPTGKLSGPSGVR